MKYSVCIPNYNYEKYLGTTIESILANDYPDIEIPIADNQSTDNSLSIIKDFAEKNPNLKYVVNPSNIGFAGNLDKVASIATGQRLIMLSSDDLISNIAVNTYHSIWSKIGIEEIVLSASWNVIDPNGDKIGYTGPNNKLWFEDDIDRSLSAEFDLKIYKVESSELLRRCITQMKNPFNFCTVCYTRKSYDKMGGYSTSRLINPDKWFNWRLLSVTKFAYFVDEPLFSYRWHPSNQSAQQQKSGHLKYLVDEYRSVIELDQKMLSITGLTRIQVDKSFIHNDIIRHGLGELLKARFLKSFRIFFFGMATFPSLMLRIYGIYFYLLVLLSSPVTIPFIWIYNKLQKDHEVY